MAVDLNALNAEEVAAMLGVSRNTVYNLVKEGMLTSYNVGRKLRFTEQDVSAYISFARNSSTEAIASSATKAEGVRSRDDRFGTTGDAKAMPFRLAGNDVVADMIANYLGASGLPIQRAYESSYRALVGMYCHGVEAAVIHLFDRKTHTYNVPYVQRAIPGTPVIVIHLAKRWQGLLVQAGNPKHLRKWSDFLRDDVVMVNRDIGAGTRILLDEKLVELQSGVRRPRGYDREVASPLAMGAAVAQGRADVGLGSERVYHQVAGLDFVPLQQESLDLVLLKTERTMQTVRFLKNLTRSESFKAELASIVGYDSSNAGQIAYEA